MTLVGQPLWESCMGDMTMPEDCTFEQMMAMYGAVASVEGKEYASEQIKWYEGLWRRFKPEYDKAPDRYRDIMKLIKEGIEFWRKELME